MFCPYCGEKLPEGSLFCGNCGKPLSRPAQQSAPVQPAPAQQSAPAQPAPVQTQAPDRPAVSSRRWPAVIGVLLAIAFNIDIVATVFYGLFLVRIGADPSKVILMLQPTALLMLLAMILFFTPTRRAPGVTSIPLWLSVAYFAFSVTASFLNRSYGFRASQLVALALFVLLPAILYTVGTAPKPRSVAMAVIFLIAAVAITVAESFNVYKSIGWHGGYERYYFIYIFTHFIASAFAGAAYSIAVFFARRRFYPEKL